MSLEPLSGSADPADDPEVTSRAVTVRDRRPRWTRAGAGESARTRVLRLERSTGWRGFAAREAWESRELLLFLADRDLRVRYKQTFFGAAWAIAQPVITMVLFTLIFGRLAGLPSEGIPYPLFVLAGTVAWGLLGNGVPAASSSLVGNESLIKKVYIHKMLVPAATILVNLVDVAIAVVLLITVAACYGFWPTYRLLFLPLFVVLGAAVVLGTGLLLSAVNVVYRDVRYIVPYQVQIWLFATPVAYSVTAVPARLRPWYALNPYVGVVEGFRWSVLGRAPDLPLYAASSVLGAVLLLIVGAWVFRRLEPSFADVA